MSLRAQIVNADQLMEFVAIVESGSVSEAARALGVGRAGLSRRLSRLETRLGVRLLYRETRRLTLTPAGEELYERSRRLATDLEAALASVRQLDGTPRGPLRVSVPDPSMASADLFVAFAEDYPEVQLEVSMTPRHVDLVGEGIDVAIRFGRVTQNSLVTRTLWTVSSHPVASPAYLQRHGTPRGAEELLKHDCIVGFAGKQTPERTWPLLAGGSARVATRFCTSGIGLRIAAAERGLGIALLPRGAIAEQLREKRLVPVLEHEVGIETPLNLVFVDRELMPQRMRLFIDRAIEFFTDRFPTET